APALLSCRSAPMDARPAGPANGRRAPGSPPLPCGASPGRHRTVTSATWTRVHAGVMAVATDRSCGFTNVDPGQPSAALVGDADGPQVAPQGAGSSSRAHSARPLGRSAG